MEKKRKVVKYYPGWETAPDTTDDEIAIPLDPIEVIQLEFYESISHKLDKVIRGMITI